MIYLGGRGLVGELEMIATVSSESEAEREETGD
jgi:hypothetical protein